jgi:adenylate kinase
LSARRTCGNCKSVYNVVNNPPSEEGKCDKCGGELIHRKDDQPETIANRLDVYREQTMPILDYYEGKITIHRIDGNQSVDKVTEDIERMVQ